jgi:hypothetical protein
MFSLVRLHTGCCSQTDVPVKPSKSLVRRVRSRLAATTRRRRRSLSTWASINGYDKHRDAVF